MKSSVKWFNDNKGFGFINYMDNADVFVHYSAIKSEGYKTLAEGQEVLFDLIDTDKGYQARDVVVVNDCVNS